MINPVLEVIQCRGHWRINFQPLVFAQVFKDSAECRQMVERNSLQLRGWDYPHVPRDGNIRLRRNCCEAWIDWREYKEFWRMYQSGQFIHYLALREDWETNVPPARQQERQDLDSGLGLIGTIYQLTEIYEFASRLAQDRTDIYRRGVRISLSLRHTANRRLRLEQPIGLPLMHTYRATDVQIDVDEREYSRDEIIGSSREEAFNAIVSLFQLFGWHEPNVETIRSCQLDLLSPATRQT